MNYSVKSVGKRTIAGFHMVGPWEQTVKQGFEQLIAWVSGRQIPAQEWVAVYYDNPDQVPPEKLRCDTVVTVADDFVIPPNSEGVILTEIAGESMQSPARGWKITTSRRRGWRSSIAWCRARRIGWRKNPVLRSISTTAIRTVTGTSKCMSRWNGWRNKRLPLQWTRFFTLAYCLH